MYKAKGVIQYEDKDYFPASLFITAVFIMGYVICIAIVFLAMGGEFGKGPERWTLIGWAIGATVSLAVVQLIISVLLEIVKNTREIRNELTKVGMQLTGSPSSVVQQPPPMEPGSAVYNAETHQYEKRS